MRRDFGVRFGPVQDKLGENGMLTADFSGAQFQELMSRSEILRRALVTS